MLKDTQVEKIKIKILTYLKIKFESYSTDAHTNPNISANSKPNSKIFQGMNQGPIFGRVLKKTRGRQSRATVGTFKAKFLRLSPT